MTIGSKGIERLVLPHVGDTALEQRSQSNSVVVEVDLKR
jgi:hypothetical protein